MNKETSIDITPEDEKKKMIYHFIRSEMIQPGVSGEVTDTTIDNLIQESIEEYIEERGGIKDITDAKICVMMTIIMKMRKLDGTWVEPQ